MNEPAIIHVEGLVTRFGERVIHDHIDLDVRQGEILAVIGGSGSGKSLLMRSIIGLRRPDEGKVHVFGEDYWNLDYKARALIERRWGVLFQDGALFTALSVRENIAFPLREHTHMSERLRFDIADMKLGLVGLDPADGDKFPAELSGGMRKRVAIARALALDPELLFLDEPTSGLDPIAAATFDTLIEDLARNLDLTVFLITHDLDTLSAIADRVAVISDKKIAAIGPLAEVRAQATGWVKEYFDGPRGRAALGAAQAAGAGR
jgi:phospholipid/cholesterol/gamma-HCH transport system ATP-binding protein